MAACFPVDPGREGFFYFFFQGDCFSDRVGAGEELFWPDVYSMGSCGAIKISHWAPSVRNSTKRTGEKKGGGGHNSTSGDSELELG